MKYKRLYVFAVVINSLKDCRKYVKKSEHYISLVVVSLFSFFHHRQIIFSFMWQIYNFFCNYICF